VNIDVVMPAISPTMEKGNLVRWMKKIGDAVKPGDILVEVETDKATVDVEATGAGTLVEILVPAGAADVPVNRVIGLISVPGAPAAVPADKVESASRVHASPLAKRMMAEAGIDPNSVTGSGPQGRVIERDVKSVIALRSEIKVTLPPVSVEAPPAVPMPPARPMDGFGEIPLDAMRRTIARRLVEAKAAVPHFYLTLDCVADDLVVLRQQLNAKAPVKADGNPSYRLTINDFIVKALAVALVKVPEANAIWTDTAIRQSVHADVGVAVSVPGGLITPVVRGADTKTLSAISNEIKDLAARAQNRKLLPEEYQGGTSTVSNLGMYGVKSFSAIINPPQSTILAVGAAHPAVIVRDGKPAVATVMSVTLSTDHRVVDGAVAAQLASTFKSMIENPITILV
jgi:pyruvate dehydrogenase E2 component (dihydrolipoamide acetyltransferase)